MAKRDEYKKRDEFKPDDGIKTKTININRVSKVVKGGRIMRFSALVVAGDMKGSVGIGMGKAMEVPEAIKKAEQAARRSMTKVSLKDSSIPHETKGNYACATVLMLPAKEGNGVIAGGAVRSVVELAGIKNITTKCYGSRNPVNVVKATINGLKSLRTAEQIAELRGKTVEEIIG